MEDKTFAVLTELGILFQGEKGDVSEDIGGDAGPHSYSGHNQLSRYEGPHFQYPNMGSKEPAYLHFAPDTSLEEALTQTRLLVFLGASDSPEFRAALEQGECLTLIFEPNEEVLSGFVERIKLSRLGKGKVFIFTGDPWSFTPALQDLLPPDFFRQHTPAFFMTDRIRETYGKWASGVIDYLETLHYRYAIYPLSGQALSRAWPRRNIARGLFFDQQMHVYENMPEYLACPDISQLKNRLRGGSAILVAAGPDLGSKIDYIQRNKDRAVVICVNNAIKPLMEAGIKPHMVVINDVSIASGKVFKLISKSPETILVAHCLSDLGGDRFRQKYLFGNFMPELFGVRPEIRLHGSVISTAFGLAQHLGCIRCVLVGAQLASNNPWSLSYAKGTVYGESDDESRPLIHEHPQLYPVRTRFGKDLYTTLNFRDAALWLAENMRLSGIECINTSQSSILHGRGIRYESEPELPEAKITRSIAELFRPGPGARPNYAGAVQYLQRELELWRNVEEVAQVLLAAEGDLFEAKGRAVLEQFDRNNVTNMVERYDTFKNRMFTAHVIIDGGRNPQNGLRYYFDHVQRMAAELVATLTESEAKCRLMAEAAGVSV